MIWLWALFGLLAAVLLLTGLALSFPVRLHVLAEVDQRFRGRVLLELLDGRVPAITLIDSWRPRRRKKEEPAGRKRPGKKRSGRRWPAPPPGAVLRLVSDILSRIRIRRLRVSGIFGLGDPAATGQLYGMLVPLKYAVPGGPAKIDVVPDFSGPRLEGRAEGVVSVTPLALVPPALRFGWFIIRRRRKT